MRVCERDCLQILRLTNMFVCVRERVCESGRGGWREKVRERQCMCVCVRERERENERERERENERKKEREREHVWANVCVCVCLCARVWLCVQCVAVCCSVLQRIDRIHTRCETSDTPHQFTGHFWKKTPKCRTLLQKRPAKSGNLPWLHTHRVHTPYYKLLYCTPLPTVTTHPFTTHPYPRWPGRFPLWHTCVWHPIATHLRVTHHITTHLTSHFTTPLTNCHTRSIRHAD